MEAHAREAGGGAKRADLAHAKSPTAQAVGRLLIPGAFASRPPLHSLRLLPAAGLAVCLPGHHVSCDTAPTRGGAKSTGRQPGEELSVRR
jgi:hypothetical protein